MSLKKGFTLIEIIVSVSIFVIVMLIAVTAVLSATDADRRAQSLNAIISNLNLAVESMARDIRTGSHYESCGSACIQFLDKDGRQVEYSFVTGGPSPYLDKEYADEENSTEGRITAEDVTLTEVAFDVQGTGTDDGPERVLLHVKGSAGLGKARSEFNLQTLITSRTLDIGDLLP